MFYDSVLSKVIFSPNFFFFFFFPLWFSSPSPNPFKETQIYSCLFCCGDHYVIPVSLLPVYSVLKPTLNQVFLTVSETTERCGTSCGCFWYCLSCCWHCCCWWHSCCVWVGCCSLIVRTALVPYCSVNLSQP